MLPVLFLSLPRHDEKYSSTPWQLAKEMATRRRVYFVDNPHTLTEGIFRITDSSVGRRWIASFGTKTKVKDGVTVIYAPFVLPTNFLPSGVLHDLFTRINERILAARINRVMREEKVDQFMFVNSFTYRFPRLASWMPAAVLTAYHCIDPMVKKFTRKHGVAQQVECALRSDVVISTAPSLQRQFEGGSFPTSYYVPNAANVELFAQALKDDTQVPDQLARLEGKTMAFLGNIEQRMDMPFLLRVLELLPDWKLVMAGPMQKGPAQFLLYHPRVIYLGPVEQSAAPAILKRCDVAIIPFRKEGGLGIYPLKLHEYLAAGKPVVTTDFNTEVVQSAEGHLQVCSTPEAFAQAVEELDRVNTLERMLERSRKAQANTWRKRALQFESILEHTIRTRHERAHQELVEAESAVEVAVA